ncbi:hypothetical protein AB835_02990 [Candidatus Endobugula sertula]|uniref:diguanylate cyclase n=1 Tax=Candidatus Endobugula sertula TaxID=62101 RepID=A0A1D2QSN6_9GAMM|nr:hypothetical protein AB835_02990 [Candidatus Endobugula sertula]
MTQKNNRWRDQYRNALNQQGQLESTLAAQQALLHRTVQILSAAAEGYDAQMDKRLSAIRGSLKSNDVGGFDRMLKSLSRVTEEADKRRQDQWSGVYKSFGKIASQLQDLSPSTDMKPAIKHYKKCIPKGALLPATLNRLLEEFGNLQTQALENNPTSSNKGLLNRLFSSKSVNTAETSASPTPENSSTTIVWEDVDEDEQQAPVVVAEWVDDTSPKHRVRDIPEAVLDRPIHEPAFSRISDRVTIILTELLDHFPPVPCVVQKSTKARERISRGLNWYELVPTLEDIRDFVIQSYMGADNEYRLYLKNVYVELSHIIEALGVAIESEQQQRSAVGQLQSHVSNGIHTLHQALVDHQEIDQLKAAVETQVQCIQGALHQFIQTTEPHSLSTQLTELIDRVKKMEAQDEDIRKQLEQEKMRAITDSLTGLPNREAYSERVHEEMLRWQRYQHPLTLAVLDIDFFKKINDHYGHQTGDKVLQIVSTSVAKRLREVDFIARFGGEEFVLLLPETSINNALEMLNRIRDRLANTPMRYKEQKMTVTVSIGIANFSDDDTAETVFARADKALYDAKEGGRNQCRVG